MRIMMATYTNCVNLEKVEPKFYKYTECNFNLLQSYPFLRYFGFQYSLVLVQF